LIFLSEGLLLLTNDGDIARYLELPSSKIERKYEVIVKGNVDENILKSLSKPEGFLIGRWKYQPIIVELNDKKLERSTLTVTLTEGKNREIRKVFQFIGLKVIKLVRTDYGPYSLKGLLPGDIQEVPIKLQILSKSKLWNQC